MKIVHLAYKDGVGAVEAGSRPGANPYPDYGRAVFTLLDEDLITIRPVRYGFALQFRGGPLVLDRIMDYISTERALFPAFTFSLTVRGPGEPVWLEVTGGDGAPGDPEDRQRLPTTHLL